MSFFIADVQITTDKSFYTDTDAVVLCVRAAGYIFRAEISLIELGLFKKEGQIGDVTISILPEQHRGSDVITVGYTPQAIRQKRLSFHLLKIARTSA